MTPEINEAIKNTLQDKNISQAQLAEQLGISRQQLNHYLTGIKGQLTENWQNILDALDLELTVQPVERDE